MTTSAFPRAIAASCFPARRSFLSAASVWEIAIKKSLGKLKAPDHLAAILPRAGFRALDVTPAHAEAVALLPLHHTDPFDRLLIAQAQIEQMTLMTVDAHFSLYDGVRV
ncbi:MAG: type II toxin-antitoxin system VapC family toxin [Rhodomicrobium sp.]